MRNLIRERTLDETPVVRIPRQRRPLTERQFTRHVREAGRRERDLTVRVARAMKHEEV